MGAVWAPPRVSRQMRVCLYALQMCVWWERERQWEKKRERIMGRRYLTVELELNTVLPQPVLLCTLSRFNTAVLWWSKSLHHLMCARGCVSVHVHRRAGRRRHLIQDQADVAGHVDRSLLVDLNEGMFLIDTKSLIYFHFFNWTALLAL